MRDPPSASPLTRIRHAASRLTHRQHHQLQAAAEDIDWLECLRSRGGECPDLSPLNGSAGAPLQLSVRQDAEPLNDTAATAGPAVALSEDEVDVRELYRVVVPVMLTACLLSLLFNLLIVFSVRWVRRTLSPTLYLSLSLAVADAYASLVIGVGLVVNSLLPMVFGVDMGAFYQCFLLALEAFRLGGMMVTVLHLLALAVNHYIGILRPLHYAATVTRRSAVVAIAVMWLLPVLFFLAYFSLVPDDGFQSERCRSYQFLLHVPFRATTSTLFFVPLVLMSFMYAHMFAVVRRHQKGLQECPSNRQLRKNVKAIITTLLILGTYLLGWMPAVLFFALTCLDCPVPFTSIRLWVRVPILIAINSMIVAKSFVDPVIYVVRMPEIKAALKAVWRTRCGLVATDLPDQQVHSRTDINRLTFQMTSRKVKPNGKGAEHNGKAQPVFQC